MGPTVAIFLRPDREGPAADALLAIARSLDPKAQSSIELSIRSTLPVGGTTESRDGGRPFGFNTSEVPFTEEELRPFETVFGFMPRADINVFAYANDPTDHRMLAELALFFAARTQGVVDFGGNLGSVEAYKGILVSIPHGEGSYQVSDAEFLEWWLQDPAFHMIK